MPRGTYYYYSLVDTPLVLAWYKSGATTQLGSHFPIGKLACFHSAPFTMCRLNSQAPDESQGTGTYAMVYKSDQRAGIHGDGQRATTAVVVGDREPCCVCDGRWTPQNAAHVMRCPWVGDGKGRSPEQL